MWKMFITSSLSLVADPRVLRDKNKHTSKTSTEVLPPPLTQICFSFGIFCSEKEEIFLFHG